MTLVVLPGGINVMVVRNMWVYIGMHSNKFAVKKDRLCFVFVGKTMREEIAL